MELEFFNRDNCSGQTGGKPVMLFNLKGNIRISRAAVQQLKLKSGDSVEFCFDKEEKQWYIIPQSTNGFQVSSVSAKDGALQFNSAVLSKKVAEDFKTTEQGASLPAVVSEAEINLSKGEAEVIAYKLFMHPKPSRA